MALFNKLFASHKKSFNKGQENVCEKLFTFSKEQVRTTVFRECDFRGRKLLFDSDSVHKVALGAERCSKNEDENNLKQFLEVTNGFGYAFTKPNSDIVQLREMIFGSVAMSYRGTTFKIIKLDSPTRIICSQVFSSPSRVKHSVPSQTHSLATNSSLEQSVKLEDSGASSATSCSDQSVHSAGSDLLVCRRPQSKPLDVPKNSSLISSSGYGGEHSFSSLSSGPQSIPIDLSHSSNNSNVWLRSTSTSLERSTNSFNYSIADFCKPNSKGSKIGIALIIQLSENETEKLEHFLIEHASFIENLLWKIRQGVESVYLKHNTFISVLYDIAQNAAQWFIALLTEPCLSFYHWHSFLHCCDNSTSIITNTSIQTEHLSDRLLRCESKCLKTSRSCTNFFKSDYMGETGSGSEHRFFGRFLKSDWNRSQCSSDSMAEKFVKEFCDLIESIDVKHTNFFISTLVTAVLTHYLGWVSTISENPKQDAPNNDNPQFNQLENLYGSIGHPTKMAQTIIIGTNNSELISKIINALTYFIRCSNVKRKYFRRIDIEEENDTVNRICLDHDCIPKENFKQYADHLKEIDEMCKINERFRNAIVEKPILFKPKKLGLTKTFTCLTNLDKVCTGREDITHKKESLKLPIFIENKSKSEVVKHNVTINLNNNVTTSKNDQDDDDNVVFVLGENEKLVGLKREDKTCAIKSENDNLSVKQNISTDVFNLTNPTSSKRRFNLVQSEPTSTKKEKNTTSTNYRHQGVKFNFQQYPQIFENYMKSKNIELSNIQLSDKVNLDETFNNKILHFDTFNESDDYDNEEPLQTPSNASELEFTSDLIILKPDLQKANEYIECSSKKPDFIRSFKQNTIINEPDVNLKSKDTLRVIELPMPKSIEITPNYNFVYTSSLLRGVCDSYVSNMVLQGTLSPISKWQSTLKRDLSLSAKYPFLKGPIDESIAIIANIDTWEVQLISSHTYVIDKGVSGVPIGMSHLVANMLESLLQMKKLHTPVEYCLMHIEQRLQEFCLRSKALAQLLLDTDFCSMEILTSTLKLEINDVPLLMAIASVHTPQVTQKYGLSFQ